LQARVNFLYTDGTRKLNFSLLSPTTFT